MSSRANLILKEFGISQGVPDMEFNEHGICSLMIDEEYDITLIADSDEKIFMYGVLANVTLEEANQKSLVLIAANTFLFGTSEIVCCYESQTQAYILMKVLYLDNITASILEGTINQIIDSIKSVRSTLEEIEA
ncbi:CesT family type III secretion system chaperone [unidentified bacterial endosymbiont]|jgi:Tir chaperone protein (CesT) family|uniref:CesT family type III secretion system chaperone n=1 Tax=unidentified bacterial endosymbiont TaxID=2355 RepID=UPI0020A1CC13|nr:CesT family type III secretion system chaperone [unidentified bacterial endosymbiont]